MQPSCLADGRSRVFVVNALQEVGPTIQPASQPTWGPVSWLRHEAVAAWLDAPGPVSWLRHEAWAAWLDAPGSGSWLRHEAGAARLDAPGSVSWMRTVSLQLPVRPPTRGHAPWPLAVPHLSSVTTPRCQPDRCHGCKTAQHNGRAKRCVRQHAARPTVSMSGYQAAHAGRLQEKTSCIPHPVWCHPHHNIAVQLYTKSVPPTLGPQLRRVDWCRGLSATAGLRPCHAELGPSDMASRVARVCCQCFLARRVLPLMQAGSVWHQPQADTMQGSPTSVKSVPGLVSDRSPDDTAEERPTRHANAIQSILQMPAGPLNRYARQLKAHHAPLGFVLRYVHICAARWAPAAMRMR